MNSVEEFLCSPVSENRELSPAFKDILFGFTQFESSALCPPRFGRDKEFFCYFMHFLKNANRRLAKFVRALCAAQRRNAIKLAVASRHFVGLSVVYHLQPVFKPTKRDVVTRQNPLSLLLDPTLFCERGKRAQSIGHS